MTSIAKETATGIWMPLRTTITGPVPLDCCVATTPLDKKTRVTAGERCTRRRTWGKKAPKSRLAIPLRCQIWQMFTIFFEPET